MKNLFLLVFLLTTHCLANSQSVEDEEDKWRGIGEKAGIIYTCKNDETSLKKIDKIVERQDFPKQFKPLLYEAIRLAVKEKKYFIRGLGVRWYECKNYDFYDKQYISKFNYSLDEMIRNGIELQSVVDARRIELKILTLMDGVRPSKMLPSTDSTLPQCSDMNSCKHNCWGLLDSFGTFSVIAEFKDDIFHGKLVASNTLVGPNIARIVSGIYIFDGMGYGTISFGPNGDGVTAKYVGQMSGFDLQGIGVMKFSDGAVYIGNFYKSEYHGLGVFTNPDGSIMSGTFKTNSLFKEFKQNKETFLNTLIKIEEQTNQNREKTRKLRTLTCSDQESVELKVIFNDLAAITAQWQSKAYALRSAELAGSPKGTEFLMQELMNLHTKKSQLTEKFVKLWKSKTNSFKNKYVEKSEKYTEIRPNNRHPFLDTVAIWMTLNQDGDIEYINSPSIGPNLDPNYLYKK
jgi:hypothetical protein